MMEESSCARAYVDDLAMTVSESEYEVAKVLVELPDLIAKSEYLTRYSFAWGAKRRRSSVAETTTPTSSSLSRPTAPEVTIDIGFGAPTCETTTDKEKPKALSPATPLLFSPSETDEKSKQQNSKRKVNFKRKKEYYLKMIEELTERKKIFKEEIKNIQSYYDKEKALNLKLKAMEERINHGLQMEQPQQTQLRLNHAVEFTQPTLQFDIQDQLQQSQQSQNVVHRQPFIMDQTHRRSENCEYSHGQSLSSLSSNGGLFMTNAENVGPSVPLDLNLSLDESFMMEPSHGFNVGVGSKIGTKALAALARQRRIKICRSKNSNAASRLRYPICR